MLVVLLSSLVLPLFAYYLKKINIITVVTIIIVVGLTIVVILIVVFIFYFYDRLLSPNSEPQLTWESHLVRFNM